VAEQTYQRICRVIGELTGKDPSTIAPGQSLGYEQKPNIYASLVTQPLEIDSLDRVVLAMALEDEFSIAIPDDVVDDPALDHVGGLCAYVQGKLDAKPALKFDPAPTPRRSRPRSTPSRTASP
jgi:acyl carrier protein